MPKEFVFDPNSADGISPEARKDLAERKRIREMMMQMDRMRMREDNPAPRAKAKKTTLGEELVPRDPAGFPINLRRPVLQNPDKTISTEETITIQVGDRFYNVPTILNGKRVTKETAVQHAVRGIRGVKNPPYPNFATLKEAEAGAKARSQEIGLLRGDEM